MCILCVIQKWSRRLATMLPWLVIPLIGLWGLSQMLPPPYRFEVTSPRLACIFVLLVTLFWYEVLMPQLSAWRVHRNARLRERKRIEALELQKLRKTATRRCRNCFTPYRDQNPGGGKFMCSYCGHISKRPVLDFPLPPGLEISNSGMIKDLFGKGGKILNGRVWSLVSICPDWLDQGSWAVGSSVNGKSTYSRNNTVGLFVGDEEFIKSHPRAYFFPHIWTTSLLKSIRLLWRRLFQDSSSREDTSDANRGMLAKRGENGVQYQESRADKARRKAEEKRQARLEKELLEEEERKQREEVARLVEECRRLRDEKIEAENRARRSSSQREKDRKEAERRHQDRRKEKDRASSKSNSDVEEMEKKTTRENERKRDTDNKAENERRESQKFGIDNKGHAVESGHAVKGSPVNSVGRGNAGNRYFDRMRGTFLSSSKAFTGGSFFGKVSRTPAVSKDKPNASLDHFQVSVNRREIYPTEFESTKLAMNVDDKGTNHLQVSTVPQHKTAPKSWQQLFTQFPVVSAPSNTNVIGRPIVKPQSEPQNSQLPSRASSPPTYDNPIEFAFSFPFTLPTFPSGSMSNSSIYPAAIPHRGKVSHDAFPEEPELFEDPCYVPDPVSLLGSVSESLDDFQLNTGTVFMLDEAQRHCSFINASVPLDTNKQSPIDSPVSRLRVADENLRCPAHFPSSPKSQDVHPFPSGDLACVNEKGTWRMWNSPLVQDGLGYAGSHANWTLPVDWSRSHQEDLSNPVPQRTMASLFTKVNQLASGTRSPQKIFPGSTFGSPVPGANEDLWSQKTFARPHSAGEDRFHIKPVEDTSQKTLVYTSPSRAATDRSFDSSPANCWSKNEWAMQGSGEGTGNSSAVKPNRMYSLFGHSSDK